MTKTLTLLVALITTLNIFGQNFEGKIVYQNSFKSKLANVTDQQWNTMLGTQQQYLIKGGNYKSITNGTLSLWQLYINEDNKLYNKLSTSEAVLWNDGAVNSDEVLKAELRQGVTEILGYKCDELVLTCKSGTQTYYFTSKLGVNRDLYEKHKYGNWAEYTSRAKGLPLRAVVDNGQFTMESLAVEVKPMVLEKSVFTLPANTKTQKSPY